MKRNSGKYMIGLLCFTALMLLGIIAAVNLIHAEDTKDFTTAQWWMFAAFLAVEGVAIIGIFFCAVKCRANESAHPVDQWEKQRKRRGVWLMLAAWLASLAVMIAGIVISRRFDADVKHALRTVTIVCCLIPVAGLLVSVQAAVRANRKFNQKRVEELHRYITDQRQASPASPDQRLAALRRLRRCADAEAVCVGILGGCIAFCAGAWSNSDVPIPLCLFAALCILAAISRIRLPDGKQAWTLAGCAPQGAYPELLSLARQAADALGCTGEIRLLILPDCNAGITSVSGGYIVNLGAILLDVLSREELYCFLLHEFSHVQDKNRPAMEEMRYDQWLEQGGNANYLSDITSGLYAWLDFQYVLQYNLYRYAVSPDAETASDQAMVQFGDRLAAASGLFKCLSFDLYEWENMVSEGECLFAPAVRSKTALHDRIARFRRAMENRHEVWLELAQREIMSQRNSHPTLAMRLQGIGVFFEEIPPFSDDKPEALARDCRAAVDDMEEKAYKAGAETYAQDRKLWYEEPLARVKAWEAAGCPVTAEGYADVAEDLQTLGRFREAEALCDRAMEKLPPAAAYYACYQKGSFLLHRYDPAGLELLYRAVDGNHNFSHDGMELIGYYCCMTGNQAALDEYRRHAAELLQQDKDEYSQILTLSRRDTLTAENLPDGMLEEILGYIRSVGEAEVEKVYLVRKTISPTFFTSAFVIRYDASVSPERRDEVAHQIFRHLDTCSDWQFSLFSYEDVASAGIDRIPGGCVYSRE